MSRFLWSLILAFDPQQVRPPDDHPNLARHWTTSSLFTFLKRLVDSVVLTSLLRYVSECQLSLWRPVRRTIQLILTIPDPAHLIPSRAYIRSLRLLFRIRRSTVVPASTSSAVQRQLLGGPQSTVFTGLVDRNVPVPVPFRGSVPSQHQAHAHPVPPS